MDILITGGTGYIGKHVVAEALAAGHRVTATVRDLRREGELRAAVGAGDLLVVALDLLHDEGWAEAVGGKDAVLHTASPVPIRAPEADADVLRPAIEGTERVLSAAIAAGVPRVVVTSSIAACLGGQPKGRPYTAADWTDPDDPDTGVYARSKTLAERRAWALVEGSKTGLTTINPGFVFGPPRDAHYASSISLVERIVKGKDPMVPRLTFAAVDVRDIAEAHVKALDAPLGQRIIASGPTLWMREMAQIVKEVPGTRAATLPAPDVLMRLLARFDPMLRTVISDLGVFKEVDPAPFEALLGHPVRDVRAALRETAEFIVALERSGETLGRAGKSSKR
ncbi:MAG: NAD-dependent epimerase/dehydratase family protein [Pseudomonadota bacterium]